MKQTIGERIKKLRIQHNMTLKELGEAVDFNYSNLSKIERGIRKPHIDFLQKVADFYGIEMAYFFTDPLEREKQADSKGKKYYIHSMK
ncbi:helix-turn-helix domain-containing protein [Metabacillus sp. GX 13764]|uniref:helix-turn-helix domain-containing protein n=1 Tax=Metabacillus kandeliae TaxID=2900151 RepID=UPI001E3CF275|nr:helix-turn-helix transcriptional regulator [Metabacillus kandeliae]MCD7033133.1 helix-turn-helix domain-containing protein [Metabacillus kandeliae]